MRAVDLLACRLSGRALCGLAALLAAACHDLPDPGECGNGIVEEANGEACDEGGPSETCNESCELPCQLSAPDPSYVPVGTTPDGGMVFCPGAGFRCAPDQICRAPSGFFDLSEDPLPFNIGVSPVLGDVDNDGLPDLVGTSATNIYIRFASTTGTPLGDLVLQEAPSAESPYVVFDPNPGGMPGPPDLLFAVPTEGVALLRTDGERFTPELDLPIEAMPGLDGLIVRDPDTIPPLLGDVAVTVEHATAGPAIHVKRVEVKAPDPQAPKAVDPMDLPDCAGPPPGGWQTVATTTAGDRRSFTVVTRRVAGSGWHVCRYTHAGQGWSVTELDFPTAPPAEALLANLDADPCFELVLRGGADPLAMLDAVPPGCGFAPAPMRLEISTLLAPSRLLAAGQIVAGGIDELVFGKAVYRVCTGVEDCNGAPPGTFVPVAFPTKVDWTAAAVTDLNGDNVQDVVAARLAEADVDVVRGGLTPSVYRADTASPIFDLVAGDFDGDRLGDVAMAEALGPVNGERLVVLFGTQEATVAPPLAMSSGTGFMTHMRLGRFSKIGWIPSKRGDDGIDDLFVLNTGNMIAGPMMVNPAAGLAVGDAARLMTTPRFPPTASATSLLDGMAAGPFRANRGVEILGIVANRALFYNLGSELWSAPSNPSPSELHQPVGTLRDPTTLARAAARGMGGNQIVAFSIRTQATGPDEIRVECTATSSGSQVRELRGIDVDGDGIDELVALSDNTDPATRRMQVFRPGGGNPCPPVLEEHLAGCVDVTNVGGRLVALCRANNALIGPARQVVLIEPGVGGGLVRRLIVQLPAGDLRFATAGDYDGDGVLDVALSVHRVDDISVQLLRQCPAHDALDCRFPGRDPQ